MTGNAISCTHSTRPRPPCCGTAPPWPACRAVPTSF
ncbi:hypothetical protein PhCBS80983_g05315 [Powellomyces hirtus]|uniref:Uncharacterized protein n=1 Tax=Powellomyces hirtus TaxID=109895 RepID=A0A507DW69_9FUNG|nr:hypothetical protein PhCBS80983_g05315 [Powellomyces hirtus]